MNDTKKGIVSLLLCCTAVICTLMASVATCVCAEPLLLVYPNKPTEFHYNPVEYEAVTSSDHRYDPNYAVGGIMLWDRIAQRIPYEIYHAPHITGFKVSSSGLNEFVMMVNEFTLIVDGFFEYPRQLTNLRVRFLPDPPHSSALIVLGGNPIDYLIVPIPDINVVTPHVSGEYYSDTQSVHLQWSGSIGLRITAFGDKDGDGVYGGGIPKWSIYVRDNTVPVEHKTWGEIKAMYNSD